MTHKNFPDGDFVMELKERLTLSQTASFIKTLLSVFPTCKATRKNLLFVYFFPLFTALIKSVLRKLPNLSAWIKAACSLKPHFLTTKSTIL